MSDNNNNVNLMQQLRAELDAERVTYAKTDKAETCLQSKRLSKSLDARGCPA
jgi:hypothetical protein